MRQPSPFSQSAAANVEKRGCDTGLLDSSCAGTIQNTTTRSSLVCELRIKCATLAPFTYIDLYVIVKFLETSADFDNIVTNGVDNMNFQIEI